MDHVIGKIALVTLVVALSGAALAQQKAPAAKREYQYQGSKIEGERETPKDLYILPWQGTSLLGDYDFRVDLLRGGLKDRDQLLQEYNYFQRVGEVPGSR